MATEIEQLINVRVMGGCNHPSFTIERTKEYGRTEEYVACTQCGLRDPYVRDDALGADNTPHQRLKALIPRHCADLTMARRTLRRLEELGWRWSVEKRDGRFSFTLRNGNRCVVGRPNAQEHAAICDAVAAVAKVLV